VAFIASVECSDKRRRSIHESTRGRDENPRIILEHENDLLSQWTSHQLAAATLRPGLITEGELRDQSQRFLALLRAALQSQDGSLEIDSPSWNEARELLTEISRGRARQGFAPSETAMFVFSLKQPLFDQIRATYAKDPEGCASEIWTATILLDMLGLFTTRSFRRNARMSSRSSSRRCSSSPLPWCSSGTAFWRCR